MHHETAAAAIGRFIAAGGPGGQKRRLGLAPRLPRPVHRHLYTTGIDGQLGRPRVHHNRQIEVLAAARAAHKSEIVEGGHALAKRGVVVAQLGAIVVVVAGGERHRRAVVNVGEGDHAEHNGEGFVGAPVGRQDRAKVVG